MFHFYCFDIATYLGIQKMCRCGTSGHGLAGMVVLGWQLNLMIFKVFSNLWFY